MNDQPQCYMARWQAWMRRGCYNFLSQYIDTTVRKHLGSIFILLLLGLERLRLRILPGLVWLFISHAHTQPTAKVPPISIHTPPVHALPHIGKADIFLQTALPSILMGVDALG